MISVELIKKKCFHCGLQRKFVKGTPRDAQSICGNCWDWENDPSFARFTDEELRKLGKQLKAMLDEENKTIK